MKVEIKEIDGIYSYQSDASKISPEWNIGLGL